MRTKTRHAIPALLQSQNSSIINVSSMAGRVGFGLRSRYAAAKWSVIGFTKTLSIELGPDGFRTNAILPGLVAGDRQRRVLGAKAQRLGKRFEEVEEMAFSCTSIKEYITLDQIADQILFLAFVRGRTISCQAISICDDTKMLARFVRLRTRVTRVPALSNRTNGDRTAGSLFGFAPGHSQPNWPTRGAQSASFNDFWKPP